MEITRIKIELKSKYVCKEYMNLDRITLDRRKCNDLIAYMRKQKLQHVKDQCNFEVWSIFGTQRLQHPAFLQREVHDLTQSNCTVLLNPLKVK